MLSFITERRLKNSWLYSVSEHNGCYIVFHSLTIRGRRAKSDACRMGIYACAGDQKDGEDGTFFHRSHVRSPSVSRVQDSDELNRSSPWGSLAPGEIKLYEILLTSACGPRLAPIIANTDVAHRKAVPTVTAGPPTDSQSPLKLRIGAEESGNEVRDVASEDGDTDANQNPGCQVDGKYGTKVSILVLMFDPRMVTSGHLKEASHVRRASYCTRPRTTARMHCYSLLYVTVLWCEKDEAL